jgi:hypothetical protein
MNRQREIRRPPGDVMVKAAEPALFVTEGSLVEGGDIAVRRHSGSLAGEAPAVDAPAVDRRSVRLARAGRIVNV